jgi:hypothetical protein
MSLKANVGVSRKIADQSYGSRGASVNLEVELDSSLIQQPERLQERIRQICQMAQQAVDQELDRQIAVTGHNHEHTTAASGNGHQNANRRHNGSGRAAGRKATASQVRAIHAIINRQGLDLVETLRHHGSVDYAEDLTITQASQLIDNLKATNGKAR